MQDTKGPTAPQEHDGATLEVQLEEGTGAEATLPVALPMIALAGLLEGIDGPMAPIVYANIAGPSGPFILATLAASLEAARELLRAERVRIAAVPDQTAEGGDDGRG